MKYFRKTIRIFTFFIALVIQSNYGYSATYDSLTPTQPPRIPVTDYGDGSHKILDFLYLRYSFDIGDLNGIGFGYNYVNNFENTNTAYNLGAGFLYLNGTGSVDTTDVDIYNWNLPLNANLGMRILGTQNSNNLMLIGGLHWTYTWLVVDINSGEHDAYLYGPAYGPLFGAKAQFVLSKDVTIIPFYIFHHAIFDYSLEVDGYPVDVDIDPVTSHFLGFDIKFGSLSLGALFDMLNNTDNDKITIMFTYDLDYNSNASAAESSTEIDETKKDNKKLKKAK
ncbi:MAG TPA: hypothetical protein PKG60_14435 [Spirochaetota bacterium]|nr:hypothetical protein [Spirochaetota bacterium]HPS87142.1 hypothetical protein [Spirochaetota bacterium]